MRALMFVSLLILSACTTLSRSDCEKMDWKNEGAKSALAGELSTERFKRFEHSCGVKKNVPPDRTLFESGYSEGLKAFCTLRGGLVFGRTGQQYANTCPAETEKDFLEGYRTGRVEELSSRVNQIELDSNRYPWGPRPRPSRYRRP